ncbi:hypothetical protein [Epibacterium ulvae]|uniref:hypothetical protein n=1 Tax=Epibacterium ulvae TaxID=1156985 RepID=UPI00249003B3|nr:hypothetical protein [Epibacterium ulvae]
MFIGLCLISGSEPPYEQRCDDHLTPCLRQTKVKTVKIGQHMNDPARLERHKANVKISKIPLKFTNTSKELCNDTLAVLGCIWLQASHARVGAGLLKGSPLGAPPNPAQNSEITIKRTKGRQNMKWE